MTLLLSNLADWWEKPWLHVSRPDARAAAAWTEAARVFLSPGSLATCPRATTSPTVAVEMRYPE